MCSGVPTGRLPIAAGLDGLLVSQGCVPVPLARIFQPRPTQKLDVAFAALRLLIAEGGLVADEGEDVGAFDVEGGCRQLKPVVEGCCLDSRFILQAGLGIVNAVLGGLGGEAGEVAARYSEEG